MQQIEIEGFGISQPATNFMEAGVWCCPSAHWPPDFPTNAARISYGYNAYGVLPVGNRTNSLGLFGHYDLVSRTRRPIAESEVAVPSEMMAIGDNFRGAIALVRSASLISERWKARHQGKANVLFCDGHVDSPMLQFLLEDTSDAALVRWNRDHQPHRELLQP
jgi:prepilin-type processing-associated H-X9-DG protein